MENRFWEIGTIFKHGDATDSEGRGLNGVIRTVVAEHKRLLAAPFHAAAQKGARFTGNMSGQRKTWLPDGTLIVSWVNPYGLKPTLMTRVYAPGLPVTEEEECLLTHGWWYFVSVTEEGFSRVYPRKEAVYGPWQTSVALGTQYADDGPYKSVLFQRGTMFSGRMREVVQMLGTKSTPIEYSHTWYKTHGIYINQTTGQWWVIEIGQGTGVLAWPLPTDCELTSEDQEALGVTIPFSPGYDEELSNTDLARTLLGQNGLDDFYTGAVSYTAEMGWAFRYDGTQAANISLTYPSGGEQTATVWAVDIVADEAGDPISATLDALEHATLMVATGIPKYPYYIDGCGWTLLSFDTSTVTPSSITEVFGPDGGDCALDVFYKEGDQAPIIIRHHVNEDGAGTSTTLPDGDINTSCPAGDILIYGTGTFTDEGWSVTKSVFPEMDFGSLGRPAAAIEPSYKETNGYINEIVATAVHSTTLAIRAGVDDRVYTTRYEVVGTLSAAGGDETQLYSEIFFKPLFDRELVGLHAGQYWSKSYYGWVEYKWDSVLGGPYLENTFGLQQIVDVGYCFTPMGDQCGQYFGDWTGDSEYTTWGDSLVDLADTGTVTAVEVPTSTCPSGFIYYLVFNYVDTEILMACRLTGSSGPVENDESARIRTYIYDNKNEAWQTVRDDESYYPADDLMAKKEDCNAGALVFCSYLDAFTNYGAMYSHANDGNDLYYFGTPTAQYPIDSDAQYTTSGWIGVPFPAEPGAK